MSRKTIPLEAIQVASPCDAAWDDMTGTERMRFCHLCQKTVYNLSAMTREQADKLIRQKEGRMCVRLYRRRDGTVLTGDCPVGLRAVRRRMALWVGGAAACFLALVGWGSAMVGLKIASRPGSRGRREVGRLAGASARKPTRAEIAAARGRTVPDTIAPGLRVLFVGINPSLYSAAVGHHFARPGNRFWPALHAAGFSDRLLHPSEGRLLLEMGCGITNIADSATATADELSDAELLAGARKLVRKVKRYRPAIVAFLGVTAYRTAFGRPGAKLGRQGERVGEAAAWVLPNPSGLNAHYQLTDLAKLYAELRRAVESAAGPGASG